MLLHDAYCGAYKYLLILEEFYNLSLIINNNFKYYGNVYLNIYYLKLKYLQNICIVYTVYDTTIILFMNSNCYNILYYYKRVGGWMHRDNRRCILHLESKHEQTTLIDDIF